MNGKWKERFIPEDIALTIVSFLQVTEVCSLGSCSRFWREICASDCVWVSFCKDRWPALKISEQSSIPLMIKNKESSSHEVIELEASSVMGWRSFYIERHNEMAIKAAIVVKFVEESTSSESLEVGQFRQAVDKLVLMKMEFNDVVMFLLTSKQNVLINLVGLHYCVFWLEPKRVAHALRSLHISERQVCIKWWKLGRWFYGSRMRDESHSKKVSLAELAFFKEKEVQGILFRGAIHDVFRVQISVPDPLYTTWAWGSMHTQG